MHRELKLLHIASFTGNIGDNASHNGLYHLIQYNLDCEIKVTKLEIRKAYLNYKEDDKWLWDDKLIKKINEHDMTIVGGGNYFAPWIEASHTGTTVDLPIELIDKIKKPLVFHGVGFDPYTNGYTQNTIQKFIKFIDKISTNPYCLVAVRNDGSKRHLDVLVGEKISSFISEVPDSGFFVKPRKYIMDRFLKDNYIAINIAKDMIDKRFASDFTYEDYLEDLAAWLLWMDEEYTHFKYLFVPHIYSDIEAIYDLIKLLPDMFVREKIMVSPYIQGESSEDIFYVYKQAQFSIGNRFHTNVCSIAQNTPSIALVTYNKLYDLYNELGLNDRVIVANKGSFRKQLQALSIQTIDDREKISTLYKSVNNQLRTQANEYMAKIKLLIDKASKIDM